MSDAGNAHSSRFFVTSLIAVAVVILRRFSGDLLFNIISIDYLLAQLYQLLPCFEIFLKEALFIIMIFKRKHLIFNNNDPNKGQPLKSSPAPERN
ncbi:MAG: hypothetical protein PHR53_04080 [Bacteroidales bacterium]|nr:hypothetical protein [Bacteroidales bacterium]